MAFCLKRPNLSTNLWFKTIVSDRKTSTMIDKMPNFGFRFGPQ
jgi:hypothetical protein